MSFSRSKVFRRDPQSGDLLRDGAWVAGGQIVSAVALLGSIRVLTELMTPQEFGRLALLLGMAALALGLSVNPCLQAVMRHYPEAARAGRIAALRQAGISMIAPAVALMAAAIVCGWSVAAPWLGASWIAGLLIAAHLVVESVRASELALLGAARRQRESGLLVAADACVRPAAAVAAISLFGPSADAALAGHVAGAAVVVLGTRLSQRAERRSTSVPASGTEAADLTVALRRYARPLLPLAVFGWLSGTADRYVVAGLLSLEDAGLYAAAYALASRPFLMLGGAVEQTMRPVLQDAIAQGQAHRIERSKATWLATTTLAASLGVALFAMSSEGLARLLLAEAYRPAAALMPWIALGYALYCLATVHTRFCYAFDDTGAVLRLTMAGAVAGIAILLPAIAVAGLPGAAVAVPLRFGLEFAVARTLAGRAEDRARGMRGDVASQAAPCRAASP